MRAHRQIGAVDLDRLAAPIAADPVVRPPRHPGSSLPTDSGCVEEGDRDAGRRVVLGSADADHVSITVLGRLHPGANDYWDGNWVDSPIFVRVGGFTARVGAGLRMDEIHRFSEGLKSMHQSLTGEAVLSSLEHWINLSVKCEPSGSLTITGEICDQPGVGNRLVFELGGLDQTFVSAWIDALTDIEMDFPVLGRP